MVYDFIVGVPYSGCKYESDIVCTREDEALAMAFGAYLTGCKPMVFMQNAGVGHCLDFITGILKPAGVKIDLVINNRTSPEQHAVMGKILKRLMKLVGYETYRCD